MVNTRSDNAAGRSERSQEVRLGLVMYGGVSLAIYIFGVAQEFFRAVRGRGVYRLLKDLTDSDIVVDILSGTSAGGVNGILLAYALCNEREFSECSSIWRESADLLRLVHEPHAPAEKVHSVLDSDFYLEKMKEGLATMKRIRVDQEEDPSPVPELDLFVTGTDVDGNVYTWFDDQGHAVDVKDHRTVFMLKHRAGRKTPFAPSDTTHHALAKLARITSCFPVAFQPVELGSKADEAADALLGVWGSVNPSRSHYFLDGGVLDNKPFTTTIREIYYRVADRKVDRKLFYIEPDPERFARAGTVPVNEPSALEVALKSLISIPGYESISEDLKKLAARNEKIRRFNRLTQALDPAAPLSHDTERCIDRMKARERGEFPSGEEVSCLYFQTRLVELSERVVRGVLRERRQDVQLDHERKQAAEQLFREFDNWPADGAETLFDFDVYFRLRRLFHVMYQIEPPAPGGGAESRHRQRTLQALARQIELLDVLQAAMEYMLDEAPFRWLGREPRAVLSEVRTAFQILLDRNGLLPATYTSDWTTGDPGPSWLDQATLSAVNSTLRERVSRIVSRLQGGQSLTPPDGKFASAYAATDACERRLTQMLSQTPELDLADSYDKFVRMDSQVLPLEFLAELREKDIIETVRISPFDAQRGFSKRPGSDKVSGDVLHHFGGFLKRSWRSNDIMWGRLDTLCQLIETLFNPLRLREVVASDIGRDLLARISDPAYLESVLPAATAEERQTVSDGLARIYSGPLPEYDAARPGDFVRAFNERFEFDAVLDRLVAAAQREILEENVPSVIRDAIGQQAEWNQYRFKEQSKSGALSRSKLGFDAATQSLYQSGPGRLDPLVVAAASEQFASDLARQPRKAAELLEEGGYRVGSESVATDVPPVILLEIGAKLLLALRKSVIATVSEDTARRVRGSAANRWLGMCLWALYGLAGFLRRSGERTKFVVLGLAILSVLALVVGVKWWTPIVYTAGGVSISGLLLFIVIPAAVLVLEFLALAHCGWFTGKWFRKG